MEKNTQPARLHKILAGLDDRGRPGHVLEHFHAGDHVIGARFACGQRLSRDFFVIDGYTAFKTVKIGDTECLRRQIDALHMSAQTCHRFRQDAAAAADIEHIFAGEMGVGVDPA
ncbi:phosphatidylserine/phosphatidylglycerophosphate/cardiolipin synthase-like enzyme [Paraburkholderia sp. MM6662-R1]